MSGGSYDYLYCKDPKQLKPIMKAVEWYESCDIGPDKLQKAVDEYRNGGQDNGII